MPIRPSPSGHPKALQLALDYSRMSFSAPNLTKVSNLFQFLSSDGPVAATLPAFILVVIAAILFHRFRRTRADGIVQAGSRSYLGAPWILALTSAVLAFLGTFYAERLSSSTSVDLEADMQISRGQYVGAYINDLTLQPRWLGIAPNIRQHYRFEHIPARLTHLRIDPTNAPDAQISVFGISIISQGRVVRRFSASELASWRLYNLKPAPGDPVSFNLVSAEKADKEGDFFDADVSLVASERPDWLPYLLKILQRPDCYLIVFIACFLLFLAGGLSTLQGTIEAGLVAAIAVIAYPVTVLVSKIPFSAPPVSSAIGKSSYVGYPKLNDYLVSFVLLIACGALGWLASRYAPPDVARAQSVSDNSSNSRGRLVWLSRWLPLVVFVLLAMVYCPDLRGTLEQLHQTSFQPQGWDGQNLTFWIYLINSGYLPYRDFWYPYSGFYTQFLAFPVGPLMKWIEEVLTIWFLYLGLRYVAARERRATFLPFAMVFIPVWLNEFWSWNRYLLAIDVTLFYVAIHDIHRFEWRKHVPFALLAGFVFFYEPTQLIYAGVGMLAHTLWLALRRPELGWRAKVVLLNVLSVVRQRFVCIGLPLLAGVLPVLVFFAAKGMLHGFVGFQLSLSDLAVYGSTPARVLDWTMPILKSETIFMTLFFALALSFYACFRNRYPLDPVTLALLMTSFAGFMAMQKQITRPPILSQVQVYPCVCVLLYVLGTWARQTKAQVVVIGLFLGFVTGLVSYRGADLTLYRSVVDAPARFAGNYEVLFHRSQDIRVANAAMYDPAKSKGFDAEKTVINVLGSEFGWTPGQPVYVLGDDLAFYILFREAPPYVTNNYNMSPISEQQHVLQWLQEKRPRFVLWNSSNDSFDGIPHVVRLPLIYQFVVEHYRPVKAVGPYQILIAATEHPASDSLLWEQLFGTRVDLGHIPELTRPSDYRTCPANAVESCQRLLLVNSANATQHVTAVVTINSVVGPVQVVFDMTAGRREYIIDLDRLWFRSFIGGNPRMTSSVPGTELSIEDRLRKSNVLY